MSYEYKYLKYKTKYSQLKMHGGANNIIEFINNSSFEKIKNELHKLLLNKATYCDKVIGKGMMGEVIISAIGKTMDVKINNTIINMPIVLKKANTVGTFDMSIINDTLYIYSYKDLTGEALILIYVNDLWHKKVSPHLPYMLGYGSCGNDKVTVNRIITERHGLEEEIKVKINGIYLKPIMHPDPDYIPNNPFYKTNLATLQDMFRYILMCEKNDIMTLPNNTKCSVSKLCDFLVISYLHTHALLVDYDITLLDMSPSNIFIHWLNENSYMGNQNINNTKYIVYKLKSGRYLKIETYGLILKVGDLGASVVHPKPNLFIMGQGVNLDKTHHMIQYLIDPRLAVAFLYYFKNALPYNVFSKTIIHKIISEYPYSELALGRVPFELLKNMEDPYDILEKFSFYLVDKPQSLSDILVI